MRLRSGLATVAGLSILLAGLTPAAPVGAAAPVQVLLNGRALALNPAPTIVGDRTLVPLRGVFEAMGAQLSWNGDTRTVEATRGARFVRLTIDRRLACLSRDCATAAALDVPATIIGDRTFVPLRFIATALGVRVSWDEQRRAAVIETDKAPIADPAPITIKGVGGGDSITRPTALSVSGASGSVQYLLLDPATSTGRMVAAGPDASAAYTYTPDAAYAGTCMLVAAVTDAAGSVRYSDPVQVFVEPGPEVRVTGVKNGDTVTMPVSIKTETDFSASQITISIMDPATGKVDELGTTGAGDSLTFWPEVGQGGPRIIYAAAQDRLGNLFGSALINVNVDPAYRQYVSGVANGDVLGHSVTLRTSANYPLDGVQYLVDDRHLAWGYSYNWALTQVNNGPHTLLVKFYGKDGTVRTSGPYSFKVNVQPSFWLSGVGPGQVVSGAVSLKAGAANVNIAAVEYQLLNSAGNVAQVLGRSAGTGAVSFNPPAAGSYTVRAVGRTADGATMTTDSVTFKAYFGKTYSAQPVVAKAQFKDLAAPLAVKVFRETGLSATLQVAQAILETGWGQSAPVDKYTGQVSYNMFGIKGTGPAGSVISNTWEEYNGVAYRVDDYFRAYHSVAESWQDHADFLLKRERYAPVRAVQTDPVLGAWALKRTGYATDSQYPVKLIDIMSRYDLFRLDDITF